MKEVLVISRSSDMIVLDTPILKLQSIISSKEPIILRELLTKNEAKTIRDHAWLQTKLNKMITLPDIFLNCPNFHSINNNVEKSQVKKILHYYAFFYWNDESRSVDVYFRRMFKLRNLLSDLPEYYGLSNDDGYISMPVVQQYPRGGGYMQEHTDPTFRQKVVVNTILSTFGKDYNDGGLFFRNKNNEKIYVDSLLNPGDAFLFHPEISHGVDPIDLNSKLDWSKEDGRWMCFSTLVTLSSLQGVKDGTAGNVTTSY